MATYRKLLKNRNGDIIIPVAESPSLPHIEMVGTKTFSAVNAGQGQTATISIPTQKDTNYSVIATFNVNSSGYAFLTIAAYQKTTTSFKLEVWNPWNVKAEGGPTVDYIVVRND